MLSRVIFNYMNLKTVFCKHPNGCLHDALLQALKQIKYGLIISSLLQLIKSLKSILKGWPSFKKSFTPQYFSIILFLTSSTLALRTIKCALRWIRHKDDGLNSLLGGMAAGYVGSVTLDKNYWYILLMFVASRIISSYHQILTKKGYLSSNRNNFHYFMLFMFGNIVHGYGYFIEPDILKPDIYKLYERMSVLTPYEKRWHLSSFIYQQKQLKEAGVTIYSDVMQNKIDRLTRQVALKKIWYIYSVYSNSIFQSQVQSWRFFPSIKAPSSIGSAHDCKCALASSSAYLACCSENHTGRWLDSGSCFSHLTYYSTFGCICIPSFTARCSGLNNHTQYASLIHCFDLDFVSESSSAFVDCTFWCRCSWKLFLWYWISPHQTDRSHQLVIENEHMLNPLEKIFQPDC